MNATSVDKDTLFVSMVLNAWDTYAKRVTDFLDKVSDQGLLTQVAPDRNRVYYLIGHLTVVNDRMLPLLGIGDTHYGEQEAMFLTNPDNKELIGPTPEVLRQNWKDSLDRLSKGFKQFSIDEWFSKHSAVSEQDFEKEPNRNKLNIIINRTNHMASHYGQLLLVKEK